jgi:NAD+ kinase
MKKIGVVANTSKPEWLPAARSIVEFLMERGVEILFSPEEAASAVFRDGKSASPGRLVDADMVLSLGGDGTFLKAVRLVGEGEVPIAGVNLGGLGFLAEFSAHNFLPCLDKILAGDFRIDERMTLEANLIREGKVIRTERALNDVVVRGAGVSRVSVLETFIDEEYLTAYEADGLIVATPTGSTAYSLSADGPIVDPDLAAIVITPICPHALSNRPILIPPRKTVTVHPLAIPEGAKITVDGQTVIELLPDDSLTVTRSRKDVRLITTAEASYFKILRSKLGWGGSREL